MIPLSRLETFRLADGRGRSWPLSDLALRLGDEDHPPVTHALFHADGQLRALRWEGAPALDGQRRVLQAVPAETLDAAALPPESVWLHRDILDALILDLQNRRATRANDLWLEAEDGALRLVAADTGLRAVWRRVTRGRGGAGSAALVDWKYVEFLRGSPEAVLAGAGYHRRITHLQPGEIAHLAAGLPYLHAAELLHLLPLQLAADTLELMAPERQIQVFEELGDELALKLLSRMAPDVAADLVGHLPSDLARQCLDRLPRHAAERIVALLRWPADSTGGIMTNDVVTLPKHLTVRAALDELRQKLKGPDFVYFVYVVDDETSRRLAGVLSLRDLLIADGHSRIERIMNRYVVALQPLDSPREAAYRLVASQLAALPVVNEQGQLLGAVTVDAAVAQVAPRAWRSQAPRVFS